MAPYSEVVKTEFVKKLEDGTSVYRGQPDSEWTVFVVPYGGASVGTILNAAIQAQRDTSHPDPIFMSVNFLKAMVMQPLDIHVIKERAGKQYTNLTVNAFQKGAKVMISSMIFGNMDTESGPSYPSTHKPICPFVTHPAQVQPFKFPDDFVPPFNFYKFYETAVDPEIHKRRKELATNPKRGEDGVEWAGWIQFNGNEVLTPETASFFVDNTGHMGNMFPFTPEYEPLRRGWLPTLTFQVEFKKKWPFHSTTDQSPKTRTVGVFSRKRHFENGRFNEVVEVWSAPCGIGETGCPVEVDWREKSECLAVGGQVAMLVSPELNRRHAAPKL